MKPESFYQKAITGISIVIGLSFLYFMFTHDSEGTTVDFFLGLILGLMILGLFYWGYHSGFEARKLDEKSRRRWNKIFKDQNDSQ